MMDMDGVGRLILTAYIVVLTLLCIYGMHRYFLVMTFFRVRKNPPPLKACFRELPRVTVQLPMYNERYVARRVIEQACRIDYPRDRLEIQVLDDSTDESRELVRETVERMQAHGHDVVCLHRENRVGYKAGALEEGARIAKGEFIAIFDADFVPPPKILRETIHHFTDERVGAVQCRWEHLNRESSLLTQAQAILLDGHFLIEHTARNRTGRFMSFNGTAGIWRKTTIADAGGWQHDTVTEDLDLSYRAQLGGWRIVFLPNITAPAELPPEMNAFKAQQHRWTKGGAQTCVKLLPRVLREAPNWRIKLEAIFHLSSCLVYPLMVLLSLLIGPALIIKLIFQDEYTNGQMAFDLVLFLVGTCSALSFYIVSQRALSRSWRDISLYIPALISLGVGIAFNNAVATIEGFCRKAGEFVRTPKFGDDAADPSGGRKRRTAFRFGGAWTGWAELAIAGYLSACLLSLTFFDDWIVRVSAALPFVGLFIFGYAYVGILTLSGRLTAQRACTPNGSRTTADATASTQPQQSA